MPDNEANTKQETKAALLKSAAKMLVFCILAVMLVFGLSKLVVPTNRNMTSFSNGIEQPPNSCEVLFLGGSTVWAGISPVQLYESYGISSCNRASTNQSTISSYYTLKDALRTQRNSLKTVVIDVKPIKDGSGYVARSEQAERLTALMHPSIEKIEFAFAMAKEYRGVHPLEQLVQVLRYHSRWNELDSDSFAALTVHNGNSLHGQCIYYTSNATKDNVGKNTSSLNDQITEAIDHSEEELDAALDPARLDYFYKTLELCQAEGLNVILIKMPATTWDDVHHDSIQRIADEWNVPFVDLAMIDKRKACDIDYDIDFSDDRHLNAIGSKKVTDYFGKYLLESFDYIDANQMENNPFTPEDVLLFEQAVGDTALSRQYTLEEYLEALDDERFMVFVAARGESFEGLSDQARSQLAALGLEQCSLLSSGESYVGIIDGGRVVTEKTDEDGSEITVSGAFDGHSVNIAPRAMQPNAKLNHPLVISSTGSSNEASAQISIEDADRSESEKGLIFVVYNRNTGILIDTSSFDTHTGSRRTSDLLES